MEYSHWEYNTDDEEDDNGKDGDDIYTDDDEEADAASDENLDYWRGGIKRTSAQWE